MEDVLNIFYRIKGRGSRNTLEQYQRNLDFFFDFLDKTYGVNYLDVKAYMLMDFEDYINKNKFQDRRYKTEHLIELSMETKYSLMKSVSGLYTWLYENDYITKDLAKGIDLKKFKNKEHHDIYMTKDEVGLLMDYMRSDFEIPHKRCEEFNKIRDRFMFLLILKLGNRIGEVTSLTFEGLDLINNTITIKGENRKNKQTLVNKLDIQLKKLYNEYMEAREKRGIVSDLVFTTQNGNQLYRSNCNSTLKKRLHEANIYAEYTNDDRRIDENKGLTIHKLRHTCATMLSASNVSLISIAGVLGQRQVSITRNYTHTNNMDVDLVEL